MAPYLAALAVSALAGAWIFTRPSPFALGGDAEMLLHPLLVDAYRQLASGHLPIWTPGRWGGSPLIADAVVGALYPFYYLAYALTPFPHWRGLDVSVVAHAALLTTGLVWFLRRLDVTGLAGVACGVFILVNPTFVYIARNWHEYWAALAWWPWLFGAAAALAATPSVGMAILAATALAAPVYAGYPEFALYAGAPALAWIVLAPGPHRARRLGTALAVGIGGVLFAMPQVLPGLTMASGSIRLGPGGAERMELVNQFYVLTPTSWATVAHASSGSSLMPFKLAPGVLLLAAIGGLSGGAMRRWLLVTAVAAALLTTGHNLVFRTLHAVPPFSFFAAPLKLFYLVDFLVAVLAAIGLGTVPALSPAWGRVLVIGLVLVLAALVPGAWWLALGAVVVAAVPARALAPVATFTAVAGALAFLVSSHALQIPHAFLPGAFMDLVREPVAAGAPAGRVLALRQERVLHQVGLNFGALWDVGSWNGMGDLAQWRQHAVLENARPGAAARLARRLGADPVVVETGSPLANDLRAAGFRPTVEARGLVHLSPPAAPSSRVELVARAKALPAERAVAAARSGFAMGDGHVAIEAERLPGGARGDTHGHADVLEYRPGAARIRVTVTRPTWLLVREPYYAHWRSTIDGRPAAVLPAAGFLIGVLVDAGTHDVHIEYREPGLLLGAILAALAMIGLPLTMRRLAPRPVAAARAA
jgi:hypothetical protein